MQNVCFTKVPGSQYYTISSLIDMEAYTHLLSKTGITLVDKLQNSGTIYRVIEKDGRDLKPL